ncbi:MAG: F-type H+-transporting ATPase subunit delta [Flavobacteriaceae bacterium]|jgi:F-type H+-transporting ATPase subunit delta|tara:strand:- start:321 stop:866 length:546 start_codon:yes stop_codon:yes gene_type:complete
MRGTRAALRYAKAMLAYAQESNASEAVAKDMRSLVSLVHNNNEVQIVLQNPILHVAQKKAVLKELFSQASPQTIKLFSLLAAKNRLTLLTVTAEQYVRLYAQTQGEVNAVVTTAVALSPALEQIVLDKAKGLTKDKVQLENKIDPEIIGGFILKIGDLQYDASVVHQLKAIKATLINSNSI